MNFNKSRVFRALTAAAWVVALSIPAYTLLADDDDCCAPGAPCCVPGSPCCAGHHHAPKP